MNSEQVLRNYLRFFFHIYPFFDELKQKKAVSSDFITSLLRQPLKAIAICSIKVSNRYYSSAALTTAAHRIPSDIAQTTRDCPLR